jgi:uncharacterized protein (TIGR03792 family)
MIVVVIELLKELLLSAFARISTVVIELLKVKVVPELREKYLQKDAEIWTQALACYPGFLGKEVWINPNEPTEVILVVRWATREQWKSIPLEQLKRIEKQFAQQLGDTYRTVEVSEYQVRKFPQPN